MRKRDTSEKSLDGEYRNIVDGSLNKEERSRILDSLKTRGQILGLSAEEQDRAVEEIGLELAALHFCAWGAQALPLQFCLGPVQRWLKETKGK